MHAPPDVMLLTPSALEVSNVHNTFTYLLTLGGQQSLALVWAKAIVGNWFGE